jgi:hypothetical protein
MKTGDTVVVKEDYILNVSLGDTKIIFGEGSKGIILSTGKNECRVGFKITETITVSTKVDISTITVTKDMDL